LTTHLRLSPSLKKIDRTIWRHGWLAVALVMAVLAVFHLYLGNYYWSRQDPELEPVEEVGNYYFAQLPLRAMAAGFLATCFGVLGGISLIGYLISRTVRANRLPRWLGQAARWAFALPISGLSAVFLVLLVMNLPIFDCQKFEERCVPAERVALNVAYVGVAVAFAASPLLLVPSRMPSERTTSSR
jgi:hypothetical protein